MVDMSVSSNPLEPTLGRIEEFRQRLRKSAPKELDAMLLEREVQSLVHELGRTLMREVFCAADEQAPEVLINGQTWGNRRVSKATYTCVFGDLEEVPRSIYQQAGRGRVAIPMELRLGIVEGRYTPIVARVMSEAVAVMPEHEGEALLTTIGVACVSKSTLHRVPRAMAARHEGNRPSIERAVREQQAIPEDAVTVQVGLDGVMVPQDGEFAKTRGRKPQGPPQPARHEQRYGATKDSPADHDEKDGRAWHEASVGTVSFWDKDGEHLSTIYCGRMPESGKTTLIAQVEEELKAVVAERPDLRVVLSSDGAPLHWEALDAMASRLPEDVAMRAEEMFDFYHAAEHLTAAAEAALGKGTVDASLQASQWRELLRYHPEGASKVLGSMRYFRSRCRTNAEREELDTEIAFLANQANAGRMDYARAKEEKLPIGTGVTEAAAKTVINVRMKRAGARFSQHGGETVILFRTALLSGRLDALSRELVKSYSAEVKAAA